MPAREEVLDVPDTLAVTNEDEFAGHDGLLERERVLRKARILARSRQQDAYSKAARLCDLGHDAAAVRLKDTSRNGKAEP